MELESLALQEKNKVMQSYNNDKEFLHTFFDYENEESSYSERLNELAGRTFERASTCRNNPFIHGAFWNFSDCQYAYR